jgi:hypothetical protein
MAKGTFFKVTVLAQQLPNNTTHPPGHDGDGGVGFFPAGPVLLVKRAKIGRTTNGHPARFN